jgi:hypothetical protein
MKRSIASSRVLILVTTWLIAGAALAAEHGYVSGIVHDEVDEQLYRVDVHKINGEEPSPGYNHHAHVGRNTVTVSLVPSTTWSARLLKETDKYLYRKDIEIDVEKGKHYYLAAKVDTEADEAAIEDGTFWEPVVAEVHD